MDNDGIKFKITPGLSTLNPGEHNPDGSYTLGIAFSLPVNIQMGRTDATCNNKLHMDIHKMYID